MGDEKGSGEISHNSRYAISINSLEPDMINSVEKKRRVVIYKTTFRDKAEYDVIFNGPTGEMLEVYNI
jgi:uncharacterized protein YvpB